MNTYLLLFVGLLLSKREVKRSKIDMLQKRTLDQCFGAVKSYACPRSLYQLLDATQLLFGLFVCFLRTRRHGFVHMLYYCTVRGRTVSPVSFCTAQTTRK